MIHYINAKLNELVINKCFKTNKFNGNFESMNPDLSI